MQSLPLVARKTLAVTVPATSQLRAMATRKLACAFERKLVTRSQARAAMANGEAGVAKLIGPLLYQSNIDSQLPPSELRHSLTIDASLREQIDPFVRELAAVNIIGPTDWADTTPATANERILQLAMLGVERIAQEASANLPQTESQYTPFTICPSALLRISGDEYTAGQVESDQSGAAVAFLSDDPFVVIANPESVEEASAICCLIRAIQEKAGMYFAVPPDDVMECIDPMRSELLMDIRVALGDKPLTLDNIPATVRESIWEWYGDIPEDREDAQQLIDGINQALNSKIESEQWNITDGRVQAWLAKGKGRNVKMAKRLFDLWDQLPQLKHDVERDAIGDGYTVDVFFAWDSEFHGNYDSFQGMAEAGMPVDSFTTHRKEGRKKAGSKHPRVDSLRAAVIGSTITTAMARIILDGEPD